MLLEFGIQTFLVAQWLRTHLWMQTSTATMENSVEIS